ncbi:MAG TPA: hypothetical protein PKY81_04555 [bacterium]|nr:hypothetical protein [bacterium]HPN30206.1 hypothetical protein [bacterium]
MNENDSLKIKKHCFKNFNFYTVTADADLGLFEQIIIEYDNFDRQNLRSSGKNRLTCKKILDGKCYYLKTYYFPGAIRILKDLFRKPRAYRTLKAQQILNKSGVLTANIVFAVQNKNFFKSRFKCMAVLNEIQGKTLDNILNDSNINYSLKLDILKKAVAIMAKIHNNNFIYGDFHINNMIADNALEKIYLIDFDSFRRYFFNSSKSMLKEFFKFNRYLKKHIKIEDREQLLDFYLSQRNSFYEQNRIDKQKSKMDFY